MVLAIVATLFLEEGEIGARWQAGKTGQEIGARWQAALIKPDASGAGVPANGGSLSTAGKTKSLSFQQNAALRAS